MTQQMTAESIPGYRFGDPNLPAAMLDADGFANLKQAVLFTDDDLAALKRAGDLLVPRTEEILDVWYGFVGSHPFLLDSFVRSDGPSGDYLARVRARFGQWIADTCRASYDETWLAYQQEIGRRHLTGKNETDGAAAAGTPPLVSLRYINALVYPIYATVRPFLESGGDDPATIERMHQAWLKSVLLQATLWSAVYTRDGAW
jgi:hypothetical protein